MPKSPAAFMSYARFDDRHDGQITKFRESLSDEVGEQIGEEFPIFQDDNDIAWGQAWQRRIDDTLDAVTFLLVIITPSFFHSNACREEVNRFLARERKLRRQDLILPVYYVSTPELEEPGRRDADPLAQELARRQVADWRELRLEPLDSFPPRKQLAQLATRIRDAYLEYVRSTHVVDPSPQRGDFTTVGAAIKAARPGDRILVRPGLYKEGLVIRKPLEILGDGPVADIEVWARNADAIWFKASTGRVANLSLRQAGCTDESEEEWYGVDISQGRLELEDCDVASQDTACIAIRDGADPHLRRNRLHDGEYGVNVYDHGLGTLEDNEITANADDGVAIATGATPRCAATRSTTTRMLASTCMTAAWGRWKTTRSPPMPPPV